MKAIKLFKSLAGDGNPVFITDMTYPTELIGAMGAMLNNAGRTAYILGGFDPDPARVGNFLPGMVWRGGKVYAWEGETVPAGQYLYAAMRESTSRVSLGGTQYNAYEEYFLYAAATSTDTSIENGVLVDPRPISAFTINALKAPLIPNLSIGNEQLKDKSITAEKMADGTIPNTAVPLGMVQVWAGLAIPVNYALCDGRQLAQADYPALYAAIGARYNAGPNYLGQALTTDAGNFRIPDLRGRFLVGFNDADPEYNTYGKIGGEKKHQLTSIEMPAHVHSVDDGYMLELSRGDLTAVSGKRGLLGSYTGSGMGDNDNNTIYYETHDTHTAGLGQTHENRPPYYTLAYVMQLK